MKKFIKVRDFCPDKGWHDVLCMTDDGNNWTSVKIEQNPDNVVYYSDCYTPLDSVVLPDGSFREVIWQSDKPV